MASQISYRPLLIGRGRLALHFKYILKETPLLTWDRSQSSEELQEKALLASHILLAVSDSAIETVSEQLRTYLVSKTEKPILIHFSGAHNFQGVEDAHPLMSYGPTLYSPEIYEHFTFVSSSTKRFEDLFPTLKNPHVKIRLEQKSRYHALCVLGGNFTVLLIQEMLKGFQELHIENVNSAPYVQKIFENILQNPKTALTGPLVRGDTATLRRNLIALKDHPYAPVYRSMVEAYSPELFQSLSKVEVTK
jgi:predicted short-subunit dehydrogenase-like oxidoreductase (DUF2520 family)